MEVFMRKSLLLGIYVQRLLLPSKATSKRCSLAVPSLDWNVQEWEAEVVKGSDVLTKALTGPGASLTDHSCEDGPARVL